MKLICPECKGRLEKTRWTFPDGEEFKGYRCPHCGFSIREDAE